MIPDLKFCLSKWKIQGRYKEGTIVQQKEEIVMHRETPKAPLGVSLTQRYIFQEG